MEKAKEDVKDLKPEEKTDEPKKEDTKKATTSAAPKSMAEIAAAQKASSWECQGCFSRNDNAKIQCPACETAKPGCEDEVAKKKEAAKAAQPVMTIGAGGGFKFGGGAGAASTGSGFSFGSPASTTTAAAPSGGGFSFGTPSRTAETPAGGGFSFGTPTNQTKPAETVKSPFGTTNAHEFSFGGVSKTSPRKHNTSNVSEEDLYENEDEGEHIYFEPVVPLPDKVDRFVDLLSYLVSE